MGKKYIGETTRTDPERRWKEHQIAIKSGKGCPLLRKAILDPCGFKMSTFMVKIPEGFLPQMASFFITQGQQDRAHF